MDEYKTVIKPKRNFALFDFAEVFRFRELLYIFSWRDIKIRYKQTVLGVLWVVFQPILQMVVFTVFFGKLAKIPSYDMPYSLFVLTGLVFWNYFSNTLTNASQSMRMNEGIIKKIYFPKVILPISSFLTTSVDFTINLFILFVFALVLGYFPDISILWILPFCITVTMFASLGLGFFFSSLNVKYRDVGFILPYFFQMLLFVSPVIYPLAIVGERNRLIMALNPMTTVVEMTRSVFSEGVFPKFEIILISLLSTFIIFIFGLWYFKKTEAYFADVV